MKCASVPILCRVLLYSCLLRLSCEPWFCCAGVAACTTASWGPIACLQGTLLFAVPGTAVCMGCVCMMSGCLSGLSWHAVVLLHGSSRACVCSAITCHPCFQVMRMLFAQQSNPGWFIRGHMLIWKCCTLSSFVTHVWAAHVCCQLAQHSGCCCATKQQPAYAAAAACIRRWGAINMLLGGMLPCT